MKPISEVMGEAGRESLVRQLRARAEEDARLLRDAGWTEDEDGLWSKGRRRGLHLFDAVEVARENE